MKRFKWRIEIVGKKHPNSKPQTITDGGDVECIHGSFGTMIDAVISITINNNPEVTHPLGVTLTVWSDEMPQPEEVPV